jgi:membrane protein
MGAASLAFHGFLALLPVVVATVALLDLVGLSSAQLHHLVHAISVLLPEQMAKILNGELLKPPSRRVNVVEVVLGLVVALWSSVEAMAALQVALDAAYEAPGDRGLVGRRLMALPLIGVTVVLGAVASVLLVLGGPIGHLLPAGTHPLLSVLRYGGSLVLMTLLLSSYYSFGPTMGASVWEWVSPGGVLAAVGWVLTSLGFSFYLDHFGHESRTYGALAGVAVTLLWFFLTAVVVLFGAELNRGLERLCELPRRETGGGEGSPAT